MRGERREHRRADEALRKSEALFRAVVDHSPAKIHIKDVDGRYVLINKEAERLYGVTDEEGRGKTPYDLFPEEAADAFMVHDRAAIVSGKAVEEEEEFTLDDGVHTYLTVKFPIYDLGGFSAVGAISTDITELKRTEEALKERERRFRAVTETANDAIISIDQGGKVVMWNEAAEKIFGYPETEIIGKPLTKIIPKRFRKKHKEGLKHLNKTGASDLLGNTMELVGLRKDGREFPIELSLSMWKTGEAVNYVGIARDVTEHKKAEAALRKLSSAVEQSPASVAITDTEGIIEYANPKFTEITGYSAEEAIGQTPLMLKSGETPAAVYKSLWAAIKSGKGWQGTLRNRRKDGTVCLAGLSIAPITAPDGAVTHFVWAQQDITQRVEDERRLKQAEKMDSLGGLAGGIAHDFNNMLLPILSLTDMTRKSLPEDSRERLRLDKVIEAATRAKDLVTGILAFSRQEDAKQENIDIHAAIHETMDLLRSTLLTTIKIKHRLKRDTGTVFADPAQIASVLLNLASNAADAMDGKTGEITVSLSPVKVGKKKAASIPGLRQGKFAKLAVKDDGHGMDEETLDRVMDPFFTTKPVGEGTGMGLSMVHGIVAKHGGAVNISSAPGKGTMVEVYLPLVEREAGPASRDGDDVSGDVRKSAGSSRQPETAMEKPARKH
jgi:PAS domain S-box-containing protein